MKPKIRTAISIIALVIMAGIFFVAIGCYGISANTNGHYIDLTNINSTMAYSQVCDMVNNPNDYRGKTIKARGICEISDNNITNIIHYYIVIKDATGCCSQSMEFVLKNSNYPSKNKTITIEGVLETYKRNGKTYCKLSSAKLL